MDKAEYKKQWYLANRERLLAERRQYHEKNKEEVNRKRKKKR